MPRIATNFNDVPDEIKPLDPGIYTMVVRSANIEPTKDGKGEKVVVELEVDDETSPNKGRKCFDHLSLKLPIGLKRLAKSCGINPGAQGLDLEDLIGKIAKVRVKTRTYKDAETQEVRETSSVAEYMF